MDFDIPNDDLARLASDPSYTGGFSGDVVDLYRQTLQIVAAVPSESALEGFMCLKYSAVPGQKTLRKIALSNVASLIVRMQNGRRDPKMIIERIDQKGNKK